MAIAALTKMGLRVFLLTGDNRRTAKAIAEEVGIYHPNVFAQVLPSHKKNKVAELQSQGYKVSIGGLEHFTCQNELRLYSICILKAPLKHTCINFGDSHM